MTVSNEMARSQPSELLGGLVFGELFGLADALARTKMIPAALQGKRDDIVAVILRGRELGLPPMAALNSLFLISGKTGMLAETMLALVRKSPQCEQLEWSQSDGKVASLTYKRKNMPKARVFSFTLGQAQAGGVGNLQKWPDAMLRARCASALVRAEFSDVMVGGVYAIDSGELDEAVEGSRPATETPGFVKQLSRPTFPEEDQRLAAGGKAIIEAAPFEIPAVLVDIDGLNAQRPVQGEDDQSELEKHID